MLVARTRRVMVVCGVLALTVAGCTSGSPDSDSGSSTPGSPTAPAQPDRPVALTITPADKAADVAPGEPVTVAAVHGKVVEVTVTNPDGKVVAGTLAADGTTWQSTEQLGYGKTYTTAVTGKSGDGTTSNATSTFTTVAKPRRQASVSMNPVDGQTVGVGQPLAFYFDTAITDKTAVERSIKITATPATEGAFYWFSDKEVRWRPKVYWKAGTKISINAAVYGKHLGNGVYGKTDRAANVTIGDRVIAVADGGTHQMTVEINGAIVRTIPISMGKKGHESPYGTFVMMSEHTNYTMDSSTYGVPTDDANGYRLTVDIATRLSNSGIFYHSAPWSVGQQGHSNVSHGCVNMSTENARWMQSISGKGDIFAIQNSGGKPLEVWDGMGDWQLDWPTWQAGGKK